MTARNGDSYCRNSNDRIYSDMAAIKTRLNEIKTSIRNAYIDDRSKYVILVDNTTLLELEAELEKAVVRILGVEVIVDEDVDCYRIERKRNV